MCAGERGARGSRVPLWRRRASWRADRFDALWRSLRGERGGAVVMLCRPTAYPHDRHAGDHDLYSIIRVIPPCSRQGYTPQICVSPPPGHARESPPRHESTAGCRTPLYEDSHKFDCGCGWPGFWTNIQDAVYEEKDADGRRCEILCSGCGG